MNIKTKLILAATAVSLLATPALAFRDMGDAGGDSAYAIPEGHSDSGMGNYGGWYVRPGVPATRGAGWGPYASAPIAPPHHFVQHRRDNQR
jgi:hypothetical protein